MRRATARRGAGGVDHVIRNWRFWILTALWLGPFALFVGLGWMWVIERGWGWWAFLAWMGVGLIFGLLSVRWTRAAQPVLTPIDWTAPATFSPRDRAAWAIVQAEAAEGERATMAELADAHRYINTGMRLAERIARHYYPSSAEAFDHVPIAQLLTALELAADDLNRMIREVPGGDMITLAHYKTAMQAAGFVSKANEYYNYFMPLLQPVQGLVRLGAQKLLTQPAWRNMQLNVMQWFYRAYVQRLGTHLIELYSGRLVIGVDRYRRLTRRVALGAGPADASSPPLSIAVAGARGSAKAALANALDEIRKDAALRAQAGNGPLAELLADARVRELEGYVAGLDKPKLRERWARDRALDAAHRCDALILVVDAGNDDFRADSAFLQHLIDWFDRHTSLEPPSILIVMAGAGRVEPGRVDALRRTLPANSLLPIVTIDGGGDLKSEVSRQVVPELIALLPRAERAALIRELHSEATSSKAGRFVKQVGRQGRRAWGGLADHVMKNLPGFGKGGASKAPQDPKRGA
jgi:hypothetical protein